MLSASIEFRSKIAENSKVLVKATLTLANKTEVNLVGDDFIMDELSFTEATSSTNNFDIGAAIVGEFNCTLNNFDGRFDNYDFTNATICPYIGMPMEDGTTEWIRKGYYNIDQPDSYGATISLKCMDNLIKLDVPYSQIETEYPATVQIVVSDLVDACGLTLATSTFDNYEYIVYERPNDAAMTAREVLSYLMQITGNFAKADTAGHVKIGWYDKDVFIREDSLDGKWFDDGKPYQSGDTANGGDFTDYTTGYTANGGDFSYSPYAIVSAMSSCTVGLDDVVITGIRVTSQENPDEEEAKEEGKKNEVYLYGAEGYVLDISDNPFILYGKGEEIATMIGKRIVGLRFRIFDVSAIGTPVNEAGDSIIIIDSMQHQYRSFITQLTYKPGQYEKYMCGGATPARNSATAYGAVTKAIVEANSKIENEKTDRQKALEELNKRLENSSGLYKTEQKQGDGSTIYYLHDKPTLEGSMIVWKITAEAIGISSDGGRTYPYGLDVDGNTILNRIYAIGLDADYIKTGRISAKVGGNFWDLETGEFQMAFNGFKDSTGKSLDSFIKDLQQSDADKFKQMQDIVSDGTVTEAEKAAINKMLQRIQTEQAESISLYTSVYGNSNLSGTSKTNLYNSKVTLYGTDNTTGSYGNLITAINSVKNSTTKAAVTSAMSTYNTRYSTYQSNRNTFTSALQAAQLTIDTTIATNQANTAVNNQSQEQIFNKLTNGGGKQGIYLQNNMVYINATYMKAGIITDNQGYNYWDLSTGEFRLSTNTKVGTSSNNQSLSSYIQTNDSYAKADAQAVFNKWTKNGTVKGITMQDNRLYINADYIASGTIADVKGNIKWDLTNGTWYCGKDTGSKIQLGAGTMKYSYLGKDVGWIGANQMYNTTYKGLDFDLNYSSNYMTWAVQKSSNSTYSMILTYSVGAIASNFTANALNIGCTLNMNNYAIKDPTWIIGTSSFSGFTGKIVFRTISSVDTYGQITGFLSSNTTLTFNRGLLQTASGYWSG